MTVINLPAHDSEFAILALAHELVQSAEENPAGGAVVQLARMIGERADALARDRAEAEIIILSAELVQRAEENPAGAVVAQLARRIADSADALGRT